MSEQDSTEPDEVDMGKAEKDYVDTRMGAGEAGSEESVNAEPEGSSSGAVPEKALPINKCFTCGDLPPGEQVWECTLCLQKFCVNHLEPRRHHCYEGQAS